MIETAPKFDIIQVKNSALSSLNESKEKRSSDVKRKIQLSANRLSSKKFSSSAKDHYASEDI